jgi:hypothetical protein
VAVVAVAAGAFAPGAGNEAQAARTKGSGAAQASRKGDGRRLLMNGKESGRARQTKRGASEPVAGRESSGPVLMAARRASSCRNCDGNDAERHR